MIRKPEAKNQAELILSELAKHGLSLKRGHALDLVAKLEGFRGWNEYLAAEKQATVAEQPLKYLGPDFSELARKGWLTDLLLAAFFSHSAGNAVTTLYEWTSPDGKVYDLRLCGWANYKVTDDKGNVSFITSRNGRTDDYFHVLEIDASFDRVECIDAPFFEWIDEAGDPVGEIFDRIPADPSIEIARFSKYLAARNAH
jgi:hypothetical protein